VQAFLLTRLEVNLTASCAWRGSPAPLRTEAVEVEQQPGLQAIDVVALLKVLTFQRSESMHTDLEMEGRERRQSTDDTRCLCGGDYVRNQFHSTTRVLELVALQGLLWYQGEIVRNRLRGVDLHANVAFKSGRQVVCGEGKG